MNARVGIVDCAISNVGSVANALAHIGADARVIHDPGELENLTHIVLPGVGSFARGMENLNKSGFVTPLRDWAKAGKPILGLCLGMQMMAEEGEEFGPAQGLRLLPGRIIKMNLSSAELRLPHVGWNDVAVRNSSRLLAGLGPNPAFYFVHSYCYHDVQADYVRGICEYGGPQVAFVEKDNIFGAQFHPEKSQKSGLALLRSFVSVAG